MKKNSFLMVALFATMFLGVNAQKTYNLVTSNADLVTGAKYIFAGYKTTATTPPASGGHTGTNAAGWYVLGYQKANNRDAIFAVAGGTTPPASLQVTPALSNADINNAFEITLNGTSGTWVLYDAANATNLGPDKTTSANNHLKPSTATPTFTIVIASDSKAAVTCFGSEANTNATPRNIVRFNVGANTTDPVFACYNSGTQTDIYLYKEVAAPPTQVATPTISPTSTTFTTSQTVSISCTETGASIYYSTDGSTPSATSATSTLYATAFQVTTTTTVKAIAVKAGMDDSNVASETYTLAPPVTTPNVIITQVYGGGGNTGAPYKSDFIELYNTTAADINIGGWSIQYSAAGGATTVTAGNMNVFPAGTIIKAHEHYSMIGASGANGADWPVGTFDWENPINLINLAGTAGKVILMKNGTAVTPSSLNAIINDPNFGDYVTFGTGCSPVYGSNMAANLTNSQSALRKSTAGVYQYTANIGNDFDPATPNPRKGTVVTNQVAKPVISPAGGNVSAPVPVSISCTETGASIYYSTDGSTPSATSATSTLYSTAFQVTATTTVKAIAVKSGMDDSEIASETYTFMSGATFFEDFENMTGSGSYAGSVATFASGQWLVRGYTTMDANDRRNGTRSVRLRGSANDTIIPTTGMIAGNYAEMKFDKTGGIGNVSFKYGSYSTHAGGVLNLEYSIDQGATWVLAGSTPAAPSWTAGGSVLQDASFNVNISGNARIRIFKPQQTGSTSVNIDDIIITDFSGTVTQVAMPTFSHTSGNVTAPFDVTITCATEGATIHYTTDGSTPTETSPTYSTPLNITATTTVKAIAVLAGMDESNVATAIYTFPVEVANIAAFKAANTVTSTIFYKITGDVTFVWRNGRYMYVKDNTGGLLIYDSATPVITTEYTNGDVISGGIFGTATMYSGLCELIPTVNTAAGTAGTAVEPIALTMADLLANFAQYDSQLIKLTKVATVGGTFGTGSAGNIAISQEESSMVCRNNFGTITNTVLSADKEYDITGFAIPYNTDRQIAPRGTTDIAEHIEGGTPNIHTNAIEMFVSNGALNVISEGGVIEIFTVLGIKVAEVNANYGITTINGLPNNQLLIVKIGNKTGKVVVR